jgi:Glycosyl hydrolase family 20, catalytic domain
VRTTLIALLLGGLTATVAPAQEVGSAPKPLPWRGLHLIQYRTDKDLENLAGQVPQLAAKGLNVLILEVDYGFDFQTHPELRDGRNPISRTGAAQFARVCKQHGIRLIPQFQSLGHQSWRGGTLPLLKVYPQFDLTPGAFPDNKGIYCREWDPMNPEVNKVVFQLMDEIIDAFSADALHVGMDEVFLIGKPQSPSTKGKDPAQVFAKAVNDLHAHLVNERKVEMLMWADRLFDANKYHWGEWEASKVGTAGALDLIPKDIILCPWHYERMKEYPSIPLFLDHGFRVLPASWPLGRAPRAGARSPDRANAVDAAKALIEYSRQFKSPKMLGHLLTTWSRRTSSLADSPPLAECLKFLKEGNGQ